MSGFKASEALLNSASPALLLALPRAERRRAATGPFAPGSGAGPGHPAKVNGASGSGCSKGKGKQRDFGGLHPKEGGVWLPPPGLREAEIASAFNYSLSTYQMLVHLLHMNAD